MSLPPPATLRCAVDGCNLPRIDGVPWCAPHALASAPAATPSRALPDIEADAAKVYGDIGRKTYAARILALEIEQLHARALALNQEAARAIEAGRKEKSAP
jgi:hypothetical protein